jgi:hypothetical protein
MESRLRSTLEKKMKHRISRFVKHRNAKRFWMGAMLLTMVGGILWALWRPTHISTGSDVRSFELNTDFHTFRREFVQRSATEEIAEGAGFPMLEESSHRVRVDVSRGSRPLLNALRGRSSAAFESRKDYVVALDNDYLDATRLTLRQTARIRRTDIDVRSESLHACGDLRAYSIEISAAPSTGGTRIEVRVDMAVRVRVPLLMSGVADYKVEKAAEDIAKRHEESIRQYIYSAVSPQLSGELLTDL